jgi:hypothetical protein
MSNNLLLATFVRNNNVRYTVELIKNNFQLVGNKIFVLQDISDNNKKILTYNILNNNIVFSDIINNTISLHRKQETNTLYTLNALNEIVKSENGGALNSEYSVDWDNWRNSVVVTYKNDETGIFELKKIDTKLNNIIKI